jgi:hypothetical protein
VLSAPRQQPSGDKPNEEKNHWLCSTSECS